MKRARTVAITFARESAALLALTVFIFAIVVATATKLPF
jgi:hypothetical protein